MGIIGSSNESKKINKIRSEVKEILLNIITQTINSIGAEHIDKDQKLKLLQLSLHYTLHKLRSTETSEKPYED